MTKNSLKQAPYDHKGNLMEWAGYADEVGAEFTSGYSYDDGKRTALKGQWRDNTVFFDTLYYKTWERGRSAVRVIWEDAEGHAFPMFMKDMDSMLAGGHIGVASHPNGDRKACVAGKWIVVKRGGNYGISRFEE